MKSTEIRELSNQEILERMNTETATLVRMKLNHDINPLNNTNKLSEKRRTISRLMT
ncbi:MAG: 50S ribosomal protein L29, partial [Bacteroidales bacterium]|nr:50S ribosomal protein L29 [Bacteroidales bacterium]